MEENLKQLKQAIRAYDHPIRQETIRLLRENDRMTVTQLYCLLRLEQAVMSQHLAILRNAGLLTYTTKDKCKYYAVNEKNMTVLGEVAEQWVRGSYDDRFVSFENRLAAA